MPRTPQTRDQRIAALVARMPHVPRDAARAMAEATVGGRFTARGGPAALERFYAKLHATGRPPQAARPEDFAAAATSRTALIVLMKALETADPSVPLAVAQPLRKDWDRWLYTRYNAKPKRPRASRRVAHPPADWPAPWQARLDCLDRRVRVRGRRYGRLAQKTRASVVQAVGMCAAARIWAIEAVMAAARHARQFRRIWMTLAAALRQGRTHSERLTFYRDEEGVRRLRVFGRPELPSDTPLLLLDADADPVILDAVAPGARIETLSLRPNAHVVQVEDRRMSNNQLLKQTGLRRSWVGIIHAEVLRDRAERRGGVLVGATKKVVRQFFSDAGHDLDAMDEDEATALMLDTPLHGARWTWFGGRSLGDNRYRDVSAVIIIGREELPVDALEDRARAIFGDTKGAALAFVDPDAEGRRLMPEEVVPYEMTDGSLWGAHVRMHPDPRIRALQRQSRECATRQLVERLRLAHATYSKRVILGCNIPIPGLPVDDLVRFEDLVPPRMSQACAEAFLAGRPLRLSAPGLHADAPDTFESQGAAKKVKGRTPPQGIAIPAGIGTVLQVRLRRDQCGARTTEALVRADDAATARRIAEAAYGPLSAFAVIACMSAETPDKGTARAD